MPRITPFLWFDDQAEEAARFYVSVFRKDSKITAVRRYGESGPGPKGSVMTVAFRLNRQHFVALNGGPHFKFTEAVSFVISCETQRRRCNAAGSGTNTAFAGRSSPPFFQSSFKPSFPTGRNA
jgi:predicted 3-demethylubiquinone-9 3-methyltransferase (glyoxalase superfamily)